MNRPALAEWNGAFGEPSNRSVVMLAVGDGFSASEARREAFGDTTAFADFYDVTPELIDELQPQVVMSSMLGRHFDCVDLAAKLSETGFNGCYRVIGNGMPEPQLVLRELRSLFPSLRVELAIAA